jgi:hypothetical protein
MPDKNGNVYGLTILSPIIQDTKAQVCHSVALRRYLASLPRNESGPFARISGTHMCRLVVMDDVMYPGFPTQVEHLKSSYLLFEANLDGDRDEYLARMATAAPKEVDEIWRHCVGYPGIKDVPAFVAYMKKCQVPTTFYFADVNDKTVEQTLRALQVQAGLAKFVEQNQGKSPADLKQAFADFWKSLQSAAATLPGQKETLRLPCFAEEPPSHMAAATDAVDKGGK